jgi:hypothetical protein
VDCERWAWAGQDRYPGFCLTLVHERTPQAVAEALGAGTLSVLTLAEAEHRFPISSPGALLRLGTSGNWTFCFEDRAPIANRAPAIARLSAGTRLLQITKSGDGMTVMRDVVDGRQLEAFEPSTAAASGGTALRLRVDSVPAGYPRIVAALATAADETGIGLDRATLEGPLATAWSTLREPAILRR